MTRRSLSFRPRAIAAVALSACLGLAEAGVAQQVFEQVVVKVNGDILTRTQLDERVRSVLAQQQGRAIAAGDMRADAALLQEAAALAPRVAAGAIDELLILQQAADLGLEASDDDVARVLARMRVDNDISSDKEFDDLLRSQGIAPVALRESVRNQILIEQVRQDVFRRVSVREQEAEAHYHANKRDFSAEPAVVFREIFIALPPLDETRTSPTAAQAYDRGLIRFVKAQDALAAGAVFADVAASASDAGSKTAGGAVGPVDPQVLPDALRAALAKLSPGAVSPPVRTGDGYRLLKLESRSAPRPATFETFRASVVAQLLARKQAVAFAAHVKQLRARALIAWKDPALKAAYEALPIDQ